MAEELVVCSCGIASPNVEAVAAIGADGRRAVVVPRIETSKGPQPGRAAGLTPMTSLRAAITGALVAADGPWPIAPMIAAPADLVAAIGGPDPRFATPVGWADLVERLRELEPDLDVVDATVTIPAFGRHRDIRSDVHLATMNRPGWMWRTAARLTRRAARRTHSSAGAQARTL